MGGVNHADLFTARTQPAVSLGFHIIFAEIGVAMPLLMVLAEWRWRRTGDPLYRELAHRWARGTAILFAVGAVSGTVLSFELGLLWPGFMRFAGAIIGMPFSLEGFAFFTEAIFLGIYLYGWERIGPRAHLAAGIVVAGSGAASAAFVVLVNAWMNAPVGFQSAEGGRLTGIDPIAGMQSPAAFPQAIHMLLAAYAATGMAVAGIHVTRSHSSRVSARSWASTTRDASIRPTPTRKGTSSFGSPSRRLWTTHRCTSRSCVPAVTPTPPRLRSAHSSTRRVAWTQPCRRREPQDRYSQAGPVSVAS
jgi:cytochrome bd-type quinol oxidase subunit 1